VVKVMKEFLKKNKHHIFYISLMIIITLIFLSKFLDPNTIYSSDLLARIPKAAVLKESILKYHDFYPLYNPYWMSGDAFWNRPNSADFINPFINPLWFLIFIMPPVGAFKYIYIISVIGLGISMYAFMIYLIKKPQFAFVSAFIFMFNGWIMEHVRDTHISSVGAPMFIPLIMLFTIKAIKEREWVRNSVIAAIIFSLQILFAPDLKVAMWTALIFGLLLLVYIPGKNIKKRAVKIFLIGFIVSLIIFGVTAQRILPTKELIDITSRAQTPWESASGRKIPLNQVFTKMIEPIYEGMPKIHRFGKAPNVGIIAFLLALFAIYARPKNKMVLYSFLVIILSLFLVTGSFVFYFLWKYIPPFTSFRYLTRTVIIFVFAISVLAGYGSSAIFSKLERKGIKRRRTLYFALIALLILNLNVFGLSPYRDYYENPFINLEEAVADNHIMQAISKQPGIFRAHIYETRGIDWGLEYYTATLGIQTIYGYETAWDPRYLNEYLSVANQQPAKFWGIMNLKYLTARNEINLSGFKFIQKYENCTKCFQIEQTKKGYGPYLYENELFLPRAYIVNNSILIVGEKDQVTQTTYALMLNPNFKPYNTVIIMGKESINDYQQKDLGKYSAIFLTPGSIDQNSVFKLQQYVDSGRILLPDITKNKNTVSEDDINNLLASFKDDLNEIDDKDVIMHTFDKREIITNGEKGFLVLSERFSMFPGWWAKTNEGKNLEILRVDGAITSVYLDGEQSAIFEYKPRSFVVGTWITIIALISLSVYFIIYFKKRKRSSHEDFEENNKP